MIGADGLGKRPKASRQKAGAGLVQPAKEQHDHPGGGHDPGPDLSPDRLQPAQRPSQCGAGPAADHPAIGDLHDGLFADLSDHGGAQFADPGRFHAVSDVRHLHVHGPCPGIRGGGRQSFDLGQSGQARTPEPRDPDRLGSLGGSLSPDGQLPCDPVAVSRADDADPFRFLARQPGHVSAGLVAPGWSFWGSAPGRRVARD